MRTRIELVGLTALACLAMTACGGDGDDNVVVGPMSCTALGDYLSAQTNIKGVTTTLEKTTNPRCELNFTYSSRGGKAAGYAADQQQAIVLRIGLPLNAADGGTGGVQGAWNGKVRNLGGGSLVGAVGSVAAATSTGYVGSSTDSGHTNAENPGFGVIQATHETNVGRIEDFYSKSLEQQYQWALKLSKAYYGQPAAKNYWDGCSTGGRQGLVLALEHGDEFDGFLVGAPHSSHTKTSASSVWRQWVNQSVANASVTPEKQTAAVNAAIASCDGNDGVVDGILNDPRTCTFNAEANICGQPGAPASVTACLTAPEAQAINMVWDGARNDAGYKVWPAGGRAAVNGMTVADGCGNNGVMCWIQKDMTSDWRTRPLTDWDDLYQVGTNTLSPIVDMRSPVLDKVKNHGAKILMWHGGADPLINWEQSTYYYRTVAKNYGGIDNIKPWFRFFLAPGVGHCSGGVGPTPVDPFQQMVNWAEGGAAPDTIPAAKAQSATAVARTRPLCAWPTTAVYNGTGSTDDTANFHCEGNLDTKAAICENYRITPFQKEATAAYDTSVLDTPTQCDDVP